MSTRVEELKGHIKFLMEVAENQSIDLSREIAEAVKELHNEMGFRKIIFHKGGIVGGGSIKINTEPPNIDKWIESSPKGYKLENSDIQIVSPIDFAGVNEGEGLNFLKKRNIDNDIEGSIF